MLYPKSVSIQQVFLLVDIIYERLKPSLKRVGDTFAYSRYIPGRCQLLMILFLIALVMCKAFDLRVCDRKIRESRPKHT